MSKILKQTTVEIDLQHYLSIFRTLQQDIETIKTGRSMLETTLDFSIDLSPIDYDNEDSFLQAVRAYQNTLQRGAEDPLIFGFTKLFQNAFDDLESYFDSTNLSEDLQKKGKELISRTRDLKQLDEVLAFLVQKLSEDFECGG